jgi:hypothetical protein
LSLRGENFRWADLVSGNLKEAGAASLATLALSNPVVKEQFYGDADQPIVAGGRCGIAGC